MSPNKEHNKNKYLGSGQLKKNVTSMSSEPEPVTCSHDTGQRITCLDRCQSTITRMPDGKDVHCKPRLPALVYSHASTIRATSKVDREKRIEH